jgi:hypothetical protein
MTELITMVVALQAVRSSSFKLHCWDSVAGVCGVSFNGVQPLVSLQTNDADSQLP